MTHATEPDLGPLTWVKGEIDAALGRAREILERGCAGSEAAGLQFAQSHLHQVRGALDIVGLDGLTLFTDPGPGVRLQWRPESQADIIDNLGDYIRAV